MGEYMLIILNLKCVGQHVLSVRLSCIICICRVVCFSNILPVRARKGNDAYKIFWKGPKYK